MYSYIGFALEEFWSRVGEYIIYLYPLFVPWGYIYWCNIHCELVGAVYNGNGKYGY
jgi:hypothetical protein